MIKYLLLCFVLSHVTFGSKNYGGYQLWKILPQNQHEFNKLKFLWLMASNDLKLDFWQPPLAVDNEVDILVPPSAVRVLKAMKIRGHTIVKDVGKLLQIPQVVEYRSNPPREGFELDRYHPLEEIENWLNKLHQQFPNNTEIITVGKSYEGRHITGIKLSFGGEGKKAVWLNAGAHAREWIGPATINYILQQLLYNTSPVMTLLRNQLDWYIVPVFNVDGYVHTWTTDRLWRKNRSPSNTHPNCIGVDLNRNWDMQWGGEGSSSFPCSNTYRGHAAFSEPETKSLSDYLKSKAEQIKLYINLHSYSQLWMCPWGFTSGKPSAFPEMDHLQAEAVAAIHKIHGMNYTHGTIARTLYLASGNVVDWMYGKARVKYSYTVELRDKGKYGFLLPANQIIPTGEEIFEAVKTSALYILQKSTLHLNTLNPN